MLLFEELAHDIGFVEEIRNLQDNAGVNLFRRLLQDPAEERKQDLIVLLSPNPPLYGFYFVIPIQNVVVTVLIL